MHETSKSWNIDKIILKQSVINPNIVLRYSK